jgi:5-methylcytosine-specific restriction endonuclease McrA
MKWVVEHVMPRALGGHPTQRSNQWVSHRTCSDRSGGQAGAARAPTTTVRLDSNKARNIRGI